MIVSVWKSIFYDRSKSNGIGFGNLFYGQSLFSDKFSNPVFAYYFPLAYPRLSLLQPHHYLLAKHFEVSAKPGHWLSVIAVKHAQVHHNTCKLHLHRYTRALFGIFYFVLRIGQTHKCSIACIRNCKSAYQTIAPRISHRDAPQCCIVNNTFGRTEKEIHDITK